MNKNGKFRDSIPLAPFRKVLLEQLGGLDGPEFYTKCLAVSVSAGLDEYTIYDYLTRDGKRTHIRFSTADNIITCGLKLPELWWEWPLLVFYLAVDLRVEGDPSLRRERTEQMRAWRERQREAQETCENGHRKDGDWYILVRGNKKRCRECNRESSARAYAARRQRTVAA